MSEVRRGVSNKTLGERGEELAVAFLIVRGYAVLARNYRCKGGEVDIVAREGKTLVFVEVKTRRTLEYGPPQLAVTSFKQRQVSKAALTWLAERHQESAPARFDVIAVLLLAAEQPRVEQIKNAFELAY
ncbi:MAG TPA: YraN family protein [Geobacteraceae bacterium]